MKAALSEPLIGPRLVLAKVYRAPAKEASGERRRPLRRATGAFVKVPVIIFDK